MLPNTADGWESARSWALVQDWAGSRFSTPSRPLAGNASR